MAEILQFVYTKVSADRSPWKKNGFQTLFYSTEALEKKNLLDIESRIHYPGEGYTLSKTSISWLDIKGEKFQMIQFFTPLPDLVDEFGRKGMFMAHGFLLPPALWTLSSAPSAWLETIKQYSAPSFDAIFHLKGLDVASGNLAPISIPELLPEQLPAIYQALSPTELVVLETLYRIGSGEQDLALVVQATPDDALALFDRLLCWLPQEYRTRTGFDAGFDSGKIFFSPLKVMAYSQNPPVTGDPVTYIPETESISDNAPDPTLRPFLRWVAEGPVVTAQGVEDAAILSAWLLTNQSLAPEGYTQIPPGFGAANHSFIREGFGRKAASLLEETWAKWLAQAAPPKWQLEVMLDNFPPAAVAKELGAQLVRVADLPFKTVLPSHIANQAGDVAIAVRELQTQHRITRQAWEKLPEGHQIALFSLMRKYAQGKGFSPWSLLKPKDMETLGVYGSKELSEECNAWIKQTIKSSTLPICSLGEPTQKALFLKGNLHGLAEGKTDWASILDIIFLEHLLPYEKVNEFAGVAQAQGIVFTPDHLVGHIFSRPKTIPASIENLPHSRQYLLAAMVILHEAKNAELQQMGFTPAEIQKADDYRPKGLKKLFYKLFG